MKPSLSADLPAYFAGQTRRQFFRRTATGIGGMALASLLNRSLFAAQPGTLGQPHFAPRAKRVIYLFMHGGPSHVDLFDPKPELARCAGQPLPESMGPVMTRRKVGQNPLLVPSVPCRPRGQSGLEIRYFLPYIAE